MVDEVVSREGVDELALAALVRGGDRDELAVARGRRERLGPGEEARLRRGANSAAATRISGSSLVARRLDDRRDRRVVADHEPAEQLVHGRDDRGRR